MKTETQTLKLLHDMASELEMACSTAASEDYCVEIVAKDARRLLARYERLRKKLHRATSQPEGEA